MADVHIASLADVDLKPCTRCSRLSIPGGGLMNISRTCTGLKWADPSRSWSVQVRSLPPLVDHVADRASRIWVIWQCPYRHGVRSLSSQRMRAAPEQHTPWSIGAHVYAWRGQGLGNASDSGLAITSRVPIENKSPQLDFTMIIAVPSCLFCIRTQLLCEFGI